MGIIVEGVEFRPVVHDGSANHNIIGTTHLHGTNDNEENTDEYWEKKLPDEYQRYIKMSDMGLMYTSKKELYLLFRHSFLANNGGQWFSTFKSTRGICSMLPATHLISMTLDLFTKFGILETLSLPASRFKGVKKLGSAIYYTFKCRLASYVFSPHCDYACSLVFKLKDGHVLSNDWPIFEAVYSGDGERCYLLFFLVLTWEADLDLKRSVKKRDDGWLEARTLRDIAAATFFVWLTYVRKLLLEVCLLLPDAARGLNHLLTILEGRTIIHRDIKSSNILIDENWVAKISDLGLSKLSVTGFGVSLIVSNGCGTHGYCEPEYYTSRIVTKKSDVYSFGIVLFEVLCGRLCITEPDNGFILSGKSVKEYYNKGNLVKIIDPRVREHIGSYSMTKFFEIAYRCLNNDRQQRPGMNIVAKELEETLNVRKLLDFEVEKKRQRIGYVGNRNQKTHKEEKRIVASIEQTSDLDDISLDEITGKLKAFEERIKLRKGGQVESQEDNYSYMARTLRKKKGDVI
ncbi:serine-threonine/tyrosine-protein kinase catalytic domain-containing protein [Tanacetum coccineum]